MAAGQIPDCISGQEKENARFPGNLAQLAQCMLLVG
jgi:hypothetical protein